MMLEEPFASLRAFDHEHRGKDYGKLDSFADRRDSRIGLRLRVAAALG